MDTLARAPDVTTGQVVDMRVPASPEHGSRLRHRLRRLLDGHPRSTDAALVLTELFSNALLHGTCRGISGGGQDHETIDIRLNVSGALDIVLTVGNSTGEPDQADRTRAFDEGNRGLTIVKALSQDHGRHTIGHRTVAWAVLTLDDA